MDADQLKALQDKALQLDKIKEQNRTRAKRFLTNSQKAGKKQISCIIDIDSYEKINLRRDRSIKSKKALTAGQIIEQALKATSDFIRQDGSIDVDLISDMFKAYKTLINNSVNINDNIKHELKADIVQPLDNQDKKKRTKAERQILEEQIREAISNGLSTKEIMEKYQISQSYLSKISKQLNLN